MNLLIFNCGSSSLSYRVYQAQPPDSLTEIAAGKAYHVGVKSQESPYVEHRIQGRTSRQQGALQDHATAGMEILRALEEAGIRPEAVGHRFVHGGERFTQTVRITPEILPLLEACSPLAPIHNPNSLSLIYLCQAELEGIPQYAAFDTAFHAHIPDFARRYALPLELADRLGLRKFGFHGLSYQYVTWESARYLNLDLNEMRLIACHLGTGGSSAAAIEGGHSVDTSMGYSPVAGLMMSTRSGDLDPSIPLTLIEEHGYSPQQVRWLLNHESGLLGVSGFSSDLFEIVARAESGDERARLSVAMYTHRLRLFIGGFLAILGGCHALAFTDDIGQRCWQVREAVCSGLGHLGIELDPAANRTASGGSLQEISSLGSRVKILVVPTNEELVIGREVLRLVGE